MTSFTEEETTLFTAMNHEEYQAEVKAIANTDILIHDAQYTPRDYKEKKGWGHSCYIDVVNMAIDAKVKNLFLFSHDPNNNDEMISTIHRECQKIIAEKKSSLKCHIAKEILEISLD
jgi:ribonuclease BN (tRNA processing enzyme)